MPTEVGALCTVLEQYRRLFETVDLEVRLQAIENKINETK